MNTFLRSVVACIFLVIHLGSKSQLLNENFGAGIPAGWLQTPSGSWTLHPTFGLNGSACIITEELNTNTVITTIRTATLNLNGITNPTVNFKGACTKNNFICPNIAVFYEAGAGQQLVARWGSGFSPGTTYTINEGFDPNPPLDNQNIYWFTGTHTLAPSGNSMSIIFSAEFVNGGYVLLDSIVVTGKTSTISTGIAEQKESGIAIFPNPCNNNKIFATGQTISELKLYNQLGIDIPLKYEQAESGITLDVSEILPGIYYLVVIVENEKTNPMKLLIE